MSTISKRASLPLTEDDLSILRLAEDSTSREGKKLAELSGGGPITSEASLLKAVFQLGLDRLRADVMFEGYQQLAVSYESAEESVCLDAVKGRRRRHHEDGSP